MYVPGISNNNWVWIILLSGNEGIPHDTLFRLGLGAQELFGWTRYQPGHGAAPWGELILVYGVDRYIDMLP
jgi:hypothetical protein